MKRVLIVTILGILMNMPCICAQQIILTGSIEFISSGHALLQDVFASDTLAFERIENGEFLMQLSVVDDMYGRMGSLHCWDQNQRISFSMVVLLDTSDFQVRVLQDGNRILSGSPEQARLSNVIKITHELSQIISYSYEQDIVDSVNSRIGIVLEEFYIIERNSALKQIAPVILSDFIRQGVSKMEELLYCKSLCSHEVI